ncbi:MAG: hypothetical protein AB8B56_10990 [Crocinitomicaceae bacterium]
MSKLYVLENLIRPFVVVLLALTSSGLFAQADSSEKFVLLEYGFPQEDEYYEVRSNIDKKWNISHKSVAGCIVSDELVDSVRIFNDQTHLRLVKAYGEDWNDRYSRELTESFRQRQIVVRQQKVDTIIRKNENLLETVVNNADCDQLWVSILRLKETELSPIEMNNLQDESNTILYRGFLNHFEINFSNSRSTEFLMECVNCTIRTANSDGSLPVGEFFVQPSGSKKEALLKIYSSKELLLSNSFEVRNLPDPILFLNDLSSDDLVPREAINSTLTLDVRYSNDISLTLQEKFEVIKWELLIHGKTKLGGEGNQIMMGQLKELSIDDKFSLLCTVKCPDGTLRKKAAVFTLE